MQFHNGAALFVDHGFLELGGHHYTLLPSLVAPGAAGQIRLASADPQAYPLIEPDYLSDDGRYGSPLLHGLKLARQVGESAALSAHRTREVMPGEQVQSDDDLKDYIRQQAMTIYHPVGTCKMGHDDLAVVDDTLKVRGLESLWVADASVMPSIVRGNTNAPTIMIAEKAAEFIKAAQMAGPAQIAVSADD